MQEIFSCPSCGAQNIVGQASCQACGQTFQYNCPHCGSVVDSTLVNCPGCRERLYWPTPRRVKAFPRTQRGAYVDEEAQDEEGKEGKPKKKADRWLTGCLGLVIVAIVILGGYYVYDTFLNTTPATVPPPPPAPPPVSDNTTSLEPAGPADFQLAQIAAA